MLSLILISDFKDCVVWLMNLYEYCVKQYFVMFYDAMCRQTFSDCTNAVKSGIIRPKDVGIPTYAGRTV